MPEWIQNVPEGVWLLVTTVISGIGLVFWRAWKAINQADQTRVDYRRAVTEAEDRIRDDLEGLWSKERERAQDLEHSIAKLEDDLRELRTEHNALASHYEDLHDCFEAVTEALQDDEAVDWDAHEVIDEKPPPPSDLLQ